MGGIWAVVWLLLMLLLCVPGSMAEGADPIRVSSLSEPQSIIAEQDVSITIKIYNSSQQDIRQEITLFDPAGNPVEKYNGLAADQSVTYTGNWHVTNDEITKGKITFFIRYRISDDPNTEASLKSIPVLIQKEDAAPQLTANYVISPATARAGQQMIISYTLANTGNIELRNIQIENTGISATQLVQDVLAVGERVTLEDTIVMGTAELISEPSITYQALGADRVMSVGDLARRTLIPAKDGLEIGIKADRTDNIYPSETVTVTTTMKNTGDVSYNNLAVALSDGTNVDTGVELAPGASYEKTIDWVPGNSSAISVIVNGMDSNGDPVTVSSPELGFNIQDMSTALLLNVRAAAETSVIHSEPAVVRCAVEVANTGDTDATNLSVQEAGTTVATIRSLPSRETRTVVFDIETSIAGQIQFTVVGKDAQGNERRYTSNILQLTYVAPTPVPTFTPAPTAVPPTPSPVPTPTPVPSLWERLTTNVSPVVFYSIVGVIVALIILAVVLVIISRRRAAWQAKREVDSFELTPDMRDSTGRRKTKKPGKKSREPVVKGQELGENETLPKTRKKNSARQQNPNAERKKPVEGSNRSNEPAEEPPKRRTTRAERPVPEGKTLKVEPLDSRPEYPEKKVPDNSQTKVFSRATTEKMEEMEKTKRMQIPMKGKETAPENNSRTENEGVFDDIDIGSDDDLFV